MDTIYDVKCFTYVEKIKSFIANSRDLHRVYDDIIAYYFDQGKKFYILNPKTNKKVCFELVSKGSAFGHTVYHFTSVREDRDDLAVHCIVYDEN